MTRTLKEIQKEIDFNAEARRACETVKNELAASIARLEEQKAEIEAEKPKHGDFGVDNGNSPCLALYAQRAKTMRRASESYLYEREISNPNNYQVKTKFGNIFELMKNDEFIEMLATLKKQQK